MRAHSVVDGVQQSDNARGDMARGIRRAERAVGERRINLDGRARAVWAAGAAVGQVGLLQAGQINKQEGQKSAQQSPPAQNGRGAEVWGLERGEGKKIEGREDGAGRASI